jgi:hypothetical protein
LTRLGAIFQLKERNYLLTHPIFILLNFHFSKLIIRERI